MKARYGLALILTLTFGGRLVAAQIPSGSTGQCRDGSYTSATKKAGACSGHKGVQTWFSAAGSTPATTNPAAPGQEPAPASVPSPRAAAPHSAPSAATSTVPAQTAGASQQSALPAPQAPSRPSASTSPARPQASGGGPGMVWVNTSTKVYHCSGTRFYGTTKSGQYMSEADALSTGARADHNKPCTK